MEGSAHFIESDALTLSDPIARARPAARPYRATIIGIAPVDASPPRPPRSQPYDDGAIASLLSDLDLDEEPAVEPTRATAPLDSSVAARLEGLTLELNRAAHCLRSAGGALSVNRQLALALHDEARVVLDALRHLPITPVHAAALAATLALANMLQLTRPLEFQSGRYRLTRTRQISGEGTAAAGKPSDVVHDFSNCRAAPRKASRWLRLWLGATLASSLVAGLLLALGAS